MYHHYCDLARECRLRTSSQQEARRLLARALHESSWEAVGSPEEPEWLARADRWLGEVDPPQYEPLAARLVSSSGRLDRSGAEGSSARRWAIDSFGQR